MLVIMIFTLKKEVVAFGGNLTWLGDQLPSLSIWTLAFGGLDVTYLAPDVIEETRVSMEDFTYFLGTCGLMEGLWIPSVAPPFPNAPLWEPNVTL
jgi:hypothetical protein